MSLSEDVFIREAKLNREEVPSFDYYPFSLPAVKYLDKIKFDSRVTFLMSRKLYLKVKLNFRHQQIYLINVL